MVRASRRRWVAGTMAAAVLACGLAPVLAGVGDVGIEGKQLVADTLAAKAQAQAQNRGLSDALRAQEALVLLQVAQRLTPESPEVLRLLAVAAAAVGDMDLAQKSIKALVKADPEDLVAQVSFLDLLARTKPVEQQLKICQAALARPELNPQVRSEMAVRVARLLAQRGQDKEAGQALSKAVELNDVNIGAWQEVCRLQQTNKAAADERLAGIVNLLLANPYQPDALWAGARLLEATGQHEVAAIWLLAAMDGYGLSAGPPTDIWMELAVQEAVVAQALALRAGGPVTTIGTRPINWREEADRFATSLAGVENSPTSAALLAYTLRSGGSLPGPENDPFLEASRQRAAAAIVANPKPANPQDPKDPKIEEAKQRCIAALVEGVWAELYYAPKVGEAVSDVSKPENWMNQLEKLLGPENPTYVRLFGWNLLRQEKWDDAKKQLAPLAASDPWAKLGLARIAARTGQEAAARQELKALWEANPTGMLALHVLGEAKQVGLLLEETKSARDMRNVARRLPDEYLLAARQPNAVTRLSTATVGLAAGVAKPKANFDLGEPVWLEITARNLGDRPMAVGPAGGVITTLALTGNLTGLVQKNLGPFAIDTSQRVYRVERRDKLVWRVRVDQGVLRDYFYLYPTALFTPALTMVTAPRLGAPGPGQAEQLVPGLGGQMMQAGQFNREGVNVGDPRLGRDAMNIVALAKELPSSTTARQMLVGAVLQDRVYDWEEGADPIPGTTPPISQADVRTQVIEALVKVLEKGDPLVQAWLLRHAPEKLPKAVAEALNKLGDSKDPLVRMVNYERTLQRGRADANKRLRLEEELRDAAKRELDPLASKWAGLLADEAKETANAAPTTSPTPDTAAAPTTAPGR